jgi:hypothetical protein
VAQGPDGIRPSATARNSARSGRLVGNANARDMFDHARRDLDQTLTERRELATGERVRLWDR